MTQAKKPGIVNLVHDTGKSIEDEQFLFACRGSFNTSIIDNILFLTESNLLKLDTTKVAKKVYYLLVEGLQNITRHQPKTDDNDPYSGGFFLIQRKPEAYSITYGNTVMGETKDQLIARLEDISSKEPSELKEHYMDLLNNSGFSTKGGAGLGLVDMARKSSGLMHYDFKQTGDNEFFYYLNINIEIEKGLYNDHIGAECLEEAKAIHEKMMEESSILMFKGLLNEENIEYLNIQIDSALTSTNEDAKGLSLVMNELFRNMAKHACNRYNQSGKPGVFMLQKRGKGYQMVTGNYVEADRKDAIVANLKSVNELNADEISKHVAERLITSTDGGSGNGLVQLRKITGHSFDHEFFESSEDALFFILKIQVNQ